MRPPESSAASLVILLVSIAGVNAAQNLLCINSDNIINQLYIDAVDVSPSLPNRAIARECDCVRLPAKTKTIALRASNLGGEGGLQACRSVQQTVYKDWRCVSSKKVSGDAWLNASYTPMLPWKPARTYKFKNKRSCKRSRQMACHMPYREWFWAVRQIPDITCRIDFCSPSCNGCQAVGTGRCDEDKCTIGPGTEAGDIVLDDDVYVICKRNCCIDIVATNKTETPNGYARLTNAETGVVDIWEFKQAGRYLATIDVETCTTERRSYTDWVSARIRTGDTLNRWKSSFFSPELRRMFGIDVAIGGGDRSYAPWIDYWEFGVDATRSKYGGTGRSTNMKVCMTGINNHDVEFTDVDITWA